MWGRASSGITPASHRPSPLSLSLSRSSSAPLSPTCLHPGPLFRILSPRSMMPVRCTWSWLHTPSFHIRSPPIPEPGEDRRGLSDRGFVHTLSRGPNGSDSVGMTRIRSMELDASGWRRNRRLQIQVGCFGQTGFIRCLLLRKTGPSRYIYIYIYIYRPWLKGTPFQGPPGIIYRLF